MVANTISWLHVVFVNLAFSLNWRAIKLLLMKYVPSIPSGSYFLVVPTLFMQKMHLVLTKKFSSLVSQFLVSVTECNFWPTNSVVKLFRLVKQVIVSMVNQHFAFVPNQSSLLELLKNKSFWWVTVMLLQKFQKVSILLVIQRIAHSLRWKILRKTFMVPNSTQKFVTLYMVTTFWKTSLLVYVVPKVTGQWLTS